MISNILLQQLQIIPITHKHASHYNCEGRSFRGLVSTATNPNS